MNNGFFGTRKANTFKKFDSTVIGNTLNLQFAEEFDDNQFKFGWHFTNWPDTYHLNTVWPSALYVEDGNVAIMKAMLRPIPEGDFQAVLEFTSIGPRGIVGLYLTDGVTTGVGNQNVLYTYELSAGWLRGASRYINFATFQAVLITETFWANIGRQFTRVTRVGSSWYNDWSFDGRVWTGRKSFTPTGTIGYIGFGYNPGATTRMQVAYHSFRVFSPYMATDAIGKVREFEVV